MFTILYILEIGTFVIGIIMSERGRGHKTIACVYHSEMNAIKLYVMNEQRRIYFTEGLHYLVFDYWWVIRQTIVWSLLQIHWQGKLQIICTEDNSYTLFVASLNCQWCKEIFLCQIPKFRDSIITPWIHESVHSLCCTCFLYTCPCPNQFKEHITANIFLWTFLVTSETAGHILMELAFGHNQIN